VNEHNEAGFEFRKAFLIIDANESVEIGTRTRRVLNCQAPKPFSLSTLSPPRTYRFTRFGLSQGRFGELDDICILSIDMHLVS
jgi:hypothetical protein